MLPSHFRLGVVRIAHREILKVNVFPEETLINWVVDTFNPSTPGRQRQVDLCEFKASLVYGTSCRTARTTQRNPETLP